MMWGSKSWGSTTFTFANYHVEQIHKLLKSNNGSVSAVFEIMWEDPEGFGDYARESAGPILRLIEKVKAMNHDDFDDVWKELCGQDEVPQ